jgi:hypothetical protein
MTTLKMIDSMLGVLQNWDLDFMIYSNRMKIRLNLIQTLN